MNENNPLFKRLQNTKIPSASHPAFEEQLYRHLEKIAEEPVKKSKLAFFQKPVFRALSGAAAAACALFLVVFFTQTTGTAYQNPVAQYINSPQPQQHLAALAYGGQITITDKNSVLPFSLNSSIQIPASLSCGENSFLLMQYNTSSIVELQGTAQASITYPENRNNEAEISCKLITGTILVKAVSGKPSAITVETTEGVFTHTGTVFLVKTAPEKGTTVVVLEGTVTASGVQADSFSIPSGREIFIAPDTKHVSQRSVSSVSVQNLENFNTHEPYSEITAGNLYTMTVSSNIADAAITTSNGFSGIGSISFFAQKGKSFTATAAKDGFTSASATMMPTQDSQTLLFLRPVESGQKPDSTDQTEESAVRQPETSVSGKLPKGILFDWTPSMLLLEDPKGDTKTERSGADIIRVYHALSEGKHYFCIVSGNINGSILIDIEYRISASLPDGKTLVFSTHAQNNTWVTDMRLEENSSIISTGNNIGTCAEGADFMEISFPSSVTADVIAVGTRLDTIFETRMAMYQRNDVLIDQTKQVPMGY
ncbi:MAG: FecR domain-containing protein [Spirochaetales bacterium]|nr:FecR domain-containing protein [Spirochaetales bacterium]